MLCGLKVKFLVNAMPASMLTDTERLLLAYADPLDSYWGIGHDVDEAAALDLSEWKGANHLGKLLMQICIELLRPICPTRLQHQLISAMQLDTDHMFMISRGQPPHQPGADALQAQGLEPLGCQALTMPLWHQQKSILSPELLKHKIARPPSLDMMHLCGP